MDLETDFIKKMTFCSNLQSVRDQDMSIIDMKKSFRYLKVSGFQNNILKDVYEKSFGLNIFLNQMQIAELK